MNRQERRRLARDLADLARAAVHDLQAARDFDWFICWQIRYWEAKKNQEIQKRGLQIAYGHFDFYRWENICYLVRSEVFRNILPQLPTWARTLRKTEGALLGELLAIVTQEMCDREFRKLCDELDALHLDVFR